MIPYIEQPALGLGPFTIHTFGVLVATGVLVGFEVFKRRSARIGLAATVAGALTWWVVVGGFAGAHFFDRFYNFSATLEAPWTLSMPWLGISSYGGFFGAIRRLAVPAASSAVATSTRHFGSSSSRGWPRAFGSPPRLPAAAITGSRFCRATRS